MHLKRLILVCAAALLALAPACTEETGSTEDHLGECKTPGLAPRRVFSEVKLTNLVGLVQAPGDTATFYALEHQGVVKSFAAEGGARVALDLTKSVNTNNWEPGLLGIAFHPKFQENGELYVTYTGFGGPSTFEWRLSRFVSNDGGKTFDPASEQKLVILHKPNADHNGGSVAFGPDGFLYVSIGDGGEQKDPNRNAQNLNVLFGKILRIDVDDRAGKAVQYGIPADNPFAAGGGRPEIFAWGFRNPWGISFDRETGELWAGDVGQNNIDEVNLVERGKNYGWNVFEGNECHDPSQCNGFKGAVPPVVQLPHKNSPIAATSVTGGFVYRGSAIKKLQGAYVFADFTTGKLFAAFQAGEGKRDTRVVGRVAGRISAFGQDADGELYALDYNLSQVHRLIEGKCAGKPEIDPNARNYAFLAIDGIGSEEESKEYYRAIGADDSLTLDQWAKDNIGDDTVKALYQNAVDLGFWREMTCSKKIARGVGGCMVRNWENPTDAADEKKKEDNLGTVTMNVSKEGVTQFYVFNNLGKLSPKAVLDSEGEKFVPQLCTPCHGGQYAGGEASDLGSIWREFEPSAFVKHPDVSDAEAAQQWFALNQVIRQANDALRTQAEGGIPGIDQSRVAMIDYLDRMYTQEDPPVVRSVHDPAHMPDTWKTGLSSQSPEYQEAKENLWGLVVNPYCMGCHRQSVVRDFANYAHFEDLGAIVDGQSTLEALIFPNADDPKREVMPFMPQAKLMGERLRADGPAMDAIENWLTQHANPTFPQCKVTFTVKGGDMTTVGQEIHVVGNLDELSNWDWGKGGLQLGTTATTFPTWTGTRSLPQGALIEFKAVVMEDLNLVRWEAGLNHVFQVPKSSKGSVTITFQK